jgi:hypothetical protein
MVVCMQRYCHWTVIDEKCSSICPYLPEIAKYRDSSVDARVPVCTTLPKPTHCAGVASALGVAKDMVSPTKNWSGVKIDDLDDGAGQNNGGGWRMVSAGLM